MSRGTQGKWAEDKVRDWLKKYQAARASFTFNRILDARASKGAMSNPQPGDFQWFMRVETYTTPCYEEPVPGGGTKMRRVPCVLTRNGLIEVKSVEHTHRLPYGNFSPDQVARLRLRAMAGSETMVLVAFRPKSHVPYWRTAPLEFFEDRTQSRGSWDMSEIDAYTHCDDLLEMILK